MDDGGSSDPYYGAAYHGVHHRALVEESDYWQARAEIAAMYYFPGPDLDKRVFDYGCGQGQSIGLLPNAAGWDVSSEARAVARQRGIRVFDDLTEVPAGAWDMIFCRHVLEHLEQPLTVLGEMRSLLAPHGHVFLVLPRETHRPTSFRPDVNQHLYCWNFRAIYNLLHRAGLEPFQATTRWPFGWHALMPVRRRLGSAAYQLLSRAGEVFRRNGEIWIRARPV